MENEDKIFALLKRIEVLESEKLLNDKRMALMADLFLQIGSPHSDLTSIKAYAKSAGNQIHQSLIKR